MAGTTGELEAAEGVVRDGVAAIGMVAIGGPVLEASVAARGSGKAGPRRACGCGAEAVCAGTASPWGRPWWTGSPSAARPATAPPATRVTVRWLRQGEAAALAAAWATLPCRGEAAAIRTEPGPGMRGSDAGAPTVAAVRVLLLNDAGDDDDLAA